MTLIQHLKIGLVAGEASGDALGAALIVALRERLPGVEFVGIAGPKMQAVGATSWFPMERLAVRGLVEVVRHIPELLRIRRELRRRMVAEGVSMFIGIDSPDFNLALERQLKEAGLRTIHFVSPSVWAWRRGRITGIGRAVHRVLALFPFELKCYQDAGIPVSYVGHPAAANAADAGSRALARTQLGLTGDAPVVALLPGSRASEIAQHAALLWETAQRLAHELPGIRFLVPMISAAAKQQFLNLKPAHGADVPVTFLDGQASVALRAADFGLIASGTATLEAALARCPHILFYRASPLSIWIVRKMIQVPWVGLPNILAQRFVVPELIQEEATPERLTQEALTLWREPQRRQAMEEAFAKIAQELKEDTGRLAADAVISELQARHD